MSQPKKELGQHWLFDEVSLQAVADAADVQQGDTVVEIGPGKGTLTGVLLERGAKVIAVEFDKQLAVELSDNVADDSELTVVNQDILSYDFSELPKGYKVAGNIPYYLTSKLVRTLLELEHPPQTIGLLIQKEVAQRIAAQPGTMSVLSVAAQFYADVDLSIEVPARLFTPPPQVDSQVISLTTKTPLTDDRKAFFRLVKAGFGERRKKLINSMAGGLAVSKDSVSSLLDECEIDTTARAQELRIEDWVRLCKAAREKHLL